MSSYARSVAFVRQLNGDGHTIVLTSHYLEEPSRCAAASGMLTQGRLVALDSTHNLLSRFSGITCGCGSLTVRCREFAADAGRRTGKPAEYVLALHDYADVEDVLRTSAKTGSKWRLWNWSNPTLRSVRPPSCAGVRRR